jgi:hypothetical protein
VRDLPKWMREVWMREVWMRGSICWPTRLVEMMVCFGVVVVGHFDSLVWRTRLRTLTASMCRLLIAYIWMGVYVDELWA